MGDSFRSRADSPLAHRGQRVLPQGFQCALAGHPCYSEEGEAFGPHWAFTDAFPWIRTSHYLSAFFHIFSAHGGKRKRKKEKQALFRGQSHTTLTYFAFPGGIFESACDSGSGCHRMVSVAMGCGLGCFRSSPGSVQGRSQGGDTVFRLLSCLPPPPFHLHLTPVLSQNSKPIFP